MRTSISRLGWVARTLVAVIGAVVVLSGTAAAQDGPNSGNVSLSSGLDIPTAYFFRGIIQKADGFIAQPYLEGGLTLLDGDGGLSGVSVAAGTWNSLHSDKTGAELDPEMWYENDFYASLGLTFGGSVDASLTYTAYTSPNNLFGTVEEIALGISGGGLLSPYATFAFELDGQADGGSNEGTYLELGAEYGLPLPEDAPVSISIPVSLGMSLSDYYELDGVDNKFGFFNIGASLGVPLSGIPAAFGEWDFHASGNILILGDTTKAFNGDDGSQPIFTFGIGVSY